MEVYKTAFEIHVLFSEADSCQKSPLRPDQTCMYEGETGASTITNFVCFGFFSDDIALLTEHFISDLPPYSHIKQCQIHINLL